MDRSRIVLASASPRRLDLLRGLGLDPDVTPAYTEVRYIVSVESDASEDEVERVFDLADSRCPYLMVWKTPLPMKRDLRINAD